MVAILHLDLIQLWCTHLWEKMGERRGNELGMVDEDMDLRCWFSRDEQWLCTRKGHVRIASILDPSQGPLGRELTLNRTRGSIAERGQELIVITRSNVPEYMFFPDPSVADFTVTLIYDTGPDATIEFDDSKNRAVRDS